MRYLVGMSHVKRITATLVMIGAAACASAQQAPPAQPKAGPHVPLRALNEMIGKAREDLAMRLGGTVNEVTVAGWKTVQLPARVLRCDVTKGEEGEPTVPGYRIVLVYKARDYTYHSDTHTVTACPRIEAK
jgi:hypothetical protein